MFTFTFKLLGRYVRLGLIAVALLTPFTFAGFAFVRSPAATAIVVSVLTAALDFILTFATPALAYSTSQAGEAFNIGIRTLRDSWPQCAWYALVPPLAIAALARFLPDSIVSSGSRVIYLGAIALLSLLFKGATAAFYIRRYDVGDDGAVFASPEEEKSTSSLPAQAERPR